MSTFLHLAWLALLGVGAYWWGFIDGKRSVARAVGKFVSEATRDRYKGLRYSDDSKRWERRD